MESLLGFLALLWIVPAISAAIALTPHNSGILLGSQIFHKWMQIPQYKHCGCLGISFTNCPNAAITEPYICNYA
ncbi:hypothetical protein [uncultured Nostoc sp.]|uniref:hypothetical protein n=1 Tax=uncultured Nostoc sp. TaxID=340711 RepID=UPI0035C9D73F